MDPIALWRANQRTASYAPRPPVRTTTPAARSGAPAPPNFQAFLEELASSMPTRTEDEWNTLLAARTQPFINAIDQSTNQARAMNEYRLETKAGVNQGLSEGFLKMLTGGKTGAEAEQFAKEQFGGSYLPAQAMSMAADQLRQLTADFDDGDWKITGQYMEAMQQIPAIREELRAKVEQGDQDEYAQRIQTASLLLDETWRAYGADRAAYEYGTNRADELKLKKEQMDLARGELGVKGVNAGTSAVNAATSAKNADIRAAELKLKRAKQSYAKAKDKVSQQQAQQRIDIAKGNLEVARLRAETAAKPKSKKPKPGLSAAKKQELAQIAFETAADDFAANTKPLETLRDLIAAGVPFAIAIRAIQRFGKDPTADPYWTATRGWKK